MKKVKFQLKLLNEFNLIPFISGSIPQLGNWTVKDAMPMSNEQRTIDGDKELWSYDLSLSNNVNEFDYKYFLANVDQHSPANNLCVFTYETFVRSIKKEKIIFDEYGFDGIKYCLDKNCLNNQYEFKLKFISPPVSLNHRNSFEDYLVKCDVINKETDTEEVISPNNVVVTVLNGIQDAIINQPKYGIQLSYIDYSVISIRVNMKDPIFRLSLFSKRKLSNIINESTHESVGHVFIHLGHKNIGLIDAPIVSPIGHCVGTWQIRYLSINPLPNVMQKCSAVSLLNSTKDYFGSKKPYLIGHRGSGRTFQKNKKVSDILENTIESFKNAYDKGIRIIEFDVVLTKENVPVVYHDYTTCMRVHNQHNPNEVKKLRLPLQNFSCVDLQTFDFQLCHDSSIEKCPKLYKTNKPHMFPKLVNCFEMLPEDLSFNIEVKYCMRMKSGNLEENLCYVEERNIYVDSILEVCFQHVKSRKIIFSSFDPDICCMLKAKQSTFPVMFLTQGTGIYSDFKDERTQSIEKAISFAISESLYGVVALTNNVLKNLSFIKKAQEKNLCFYTWGDDNNDLETIKTLENNGVDGIILDNIEAVNHL